MKHAFLELIGIAVAHLDDVPNVGRRAELLEAAADWFDQAQTPARAIQIRAAADKLRMADEAQLNLSRLFQADT
jgi:hypothetical protein